MSLVPFPMPPGLSPQTYGPGTSRPSADGSRGGARRVVGPDRWAVLLCIEQAAQQLAPRLRVPLMPLTLTMWATARAESGFDAAAWRQEPDGRVSFGLFQALTRPPGSTGGPGAGEGHDPARLVEPVYSCDLISGEALRAAASVAPPADLRGLLTWWTRYVERPRDWAGESTRRLTWAEAVGRELGVLA